jgi:hypothetical protein
MKTWLEKEKAGLDTVADEDWKNSIPLDVSDEGVAADLERHHQEGIVSRWQSHYREPH